MTGADRSEMDGTSNASRARTDSAGRDSNYNSSSSRYVSYMDQIDDAEVLAAINKLNRRKKTMTSPSKSSAAMSSPCKSNATRTTSPSNSSIGSRSTSSSPNSCAWNQREQAKNNVTRLEQVKEEVAFDLDADAEGLGLGDNEKNQSSSFSSSLWGKMFPRREKEDRETATATTADACSATASASSGSSPNKSDATASTKASSSKSIASASLAASMANSILDTNASLSDTSDASDTFDMSDSPNSGVNKDDDLNDNNEEHTVKKIDSNGRWETLTCSAFSNKSSDDDKHHDDSNNHKQTKRGKNRRLLPKEFTVYFTAVNYMVNKLIKEDETIMNRPSHKVQRILLDQKQELATAANKRTSRSRKSSKNRTAANKGRVPRAMRNKERDAGRPVSPTSQLNTEDFDDNLTSLDDDHTDIGYDIEHGDGDTLTLTDDTENHDEDTQLDDSYDDGVPMIASMFSCSCSPTNEDRSNDEIKAQDASLKNSPSMTSHEKDLLDDLDDADDGDDEDVNGNGTDVKCIILPGKDGKLRLLAEV